MQASKFLLTSLLGTHMALGQLVLAGPPDSRFGVGTNHGGYQGQLLPNPISSQTRQTADPGLIRPVLPAKMPTSPIEGPRRGGTGGISGIGQASGSSRLASKLNITAVKPMVSLETVSPAEINVGKTASFTITVRNTGDSTAQDIMVQVVLPETAQVQRADPQPEIADRTLRFTVGDLPARTMKQLKLQIVPQQRGPINLITHATVSTSAKSVIQVREPKLSIALTAPEEALHGDLVKFKLVLANTGDGPAEAIKLALNVPEGTVDQEIAQAVAEFQSMPAKIDLLPPGQSREIELYAKAEAAGLMRADVVARGAGGLEARSAAQLFVRRPMLEIAAEGPTKRYVDGMVTYRIWVSNPGDHPAESVTVTAAVPPGLQVMAIEKRARINRDSGTLSWNLPSIAPGGNELLRFRAKAIKEGPQRSHVTASAQRGLTAQTTHVTEVFGIADVAITVRDTVSATEVGETVDFEIHMKNRGTKSARGVKVQATLAGELEAARSAEYMVQGQEVIFEPIDHLPAGGEKVLKFRVQGHQAGDHVVQVTLESESLRRTVVAQASTLFYAEDMPIDTDTDP